MNINKLYQEQLGKTLIDGDVITTRGSKVHSNIILKPAIITSFPLVTTRKTAWKKAISEMEWFMSGRPKCPDGLLDWWKGQLDKNQYYISGYPAQFRHYGHYSFDQVGYILAGLKNNPNSRRLIITAWESADMAEITLTNQNTQTPTCCHATMLQLFVRDGKLIMNHYQRSADMLLGLPHNWVQYWALLMYFAYHSGLTPGWIRYDLGDAHIYDDESHMYTAMAIIDAEPLSNTCDLVYTYSGGIESSGVPEFKADDFTVTGEIPEPAVTKRPLLIA
jgi:thymidylate synthase